MIGFISPELGLWSFEKFYTGIPGDTYVVIGLVEDNFSNFLEDKMANGNFGAVPREQVTKISIIRETKFLVIPKHSK